MASASKNKGNGYERELVVQAKDHSLEAVRARGSDGRSLGHEETVDLVIAGERIQAKRRKKIAKLYKVQPEYDATIFREDRGESWVLISYTKYLELLRDRTNK